MEALVEAIVAEVERRLVDRLADRENGDGRWLGGAKAIGEHIGCSPDRVWALSSSGRLRLHRDGSALLARTDELDAWGRPAARRRP